jgi:hypothetical protein
VGGDGRLPDRRLSFAGHAQEGVLETGRIAGGKELLRVGRGAAGTAKFFRQSKRLIEDAIG